MGLASFILAAAAAWSGWVGPEDGRPQGDDPADLVKRLGAPRFAEREAAAARLVGLGRRALPALRVARSARDPEVLTRAADLTERIEGASLTSATMVRLDARNRPLNELLRDLSEQSGMRVTLGPAGPGDERPRRPVTVTAPTPLPFWAALDRVCEAAGLHETTGLPVSNPGRDPAVTLFYGAVRSSSPVWDSGPFRVSVVGAHYQRDVNFPPVARGANVPAAAVGGIVNEQCYVQLQVTAEPRLLVGQTGSVRLSEAVDDRGSDLNPDRGGATASGEIRRQDSAYFGLGASASLHVQVPLNRPAQPGQALKSLKGSVPVQVSTRKPDPAVLKLNGTGPRSAENDDARVSLVEVRPGAENRPTTIVLEVAVKRNGSANEANPGLPRGPAHPSQVEVLDAQGRPLHWYQTQVEPDASRLTLSLLAFEHGEPAEVRYYGLVRAETRVAFEFADVPMP